MAVKGTISRHVVFTIGEEHSYSSYLSNKHTCVCNSKNEVNDLIELLERDVRALRREADATFN